MLYPFFEKLIIWIQGNQPAIRKLNNSSIARFSEAINVRFMNFRNQSNTLFRLFY